MSMFRIHPSIGVARVGNSPEYVIAPETMAGQPDRNNQDVLGGLPIRAGTENELVTSSDLRDAQGALKRHAARFRVFAYPNNGPEAWPRGNGVEITIGSEIDGRKVTSIVWTVHVANKKANWFVLREDEIQGIKSFEDGRLPKVRNPGVTEVKPQPACGQQIDFLNDPARVSALTIDPGPRCIEGGSATTVPIDRWTPPTVFDASTRALVKLPEYPVKFPDFPDMELPSGPIDTLGELRSETQGRLLVLGGYGRAAGWKLKGQTAVPVDQDVNNDQWFDDTSDGPVSATLIFDHKDAVEVVGAWVTTTDPSTAPQILNVVSAWDDIYDSWVREPSLSLEPALYNHDKKEFWKDYKPTFDDQIAPILRSAALQRWVTNLSPRGNSAHDKLADISASDNPLQTELAGINPLFRDPFKEEDPAHANTAKMPLALGDGYEPFLKLRQTQFTFLTRWNEGRFDPGSRPLGAGEYLDKAVLVNCLGGRFSPGIDVTFIVREPAIYITSWQSSGTGPFRIRKKAIDYSQPLRRDRPLLTVGYVPRHREEDGLEPGDFSKFMAVPWHTDYNSCATHPPYPNPTGNRKVFWSWPAQRPVAVNLATDVRWVTDPTLKKGEPKRLVPSLGVQRWSVRGYGTDAPEAEKWGRYQDRNDILDNWHRVGVVLQATRIDELAVPSEARTGSLKPLFLEAKGQLRDTNRTPVVPFPNIATYLEQVAPDKKAKELDPRALFHQLLNVSNFPGVLPDAREYVAWWLRQAEDLSTSAEAEPDIRYFEYTEQAFADRLDLIYDDLAQAADRHPPGDPDNVVQSRDDAIERIRQITPFNLLDGAWLRFVGRAGPQDEVRALLFSVWMDELGDGVVAMHHCNIWRDLCHSVGYYPMPINSPEFAFDPTILDSSFAVPAFELAISQFTEEYLPELIGMTLQLEWGVLELKPTRDLMRFYGINPHFYEMHIGIDNAVNGHGQRAADAVRLFLGEVRDAGGEEAVQRAWRRIWNGYVAFGSLGTWGEDLRNLLEGRRMQAQKELRQQLVTMITGKAQFGSRNHQHHTLGQTRIDAWFDDPEGFLDALVEHGYLTKGDWQNSRLRQLLEFQGGPMYRVFTDDEIALWQKYTNGLGTPLPPEPAPLPSPARQMANVVDALRPDQLGTPGHRKAMLADDKGAAHSIEWWFEQPAADFLQALGRAHNGYVVPGRPELSPLYTDLAAPTGPMGTAFNQPSPDQPPGGPHRTCRQVLYDWIKAGTQPLSTGVLSLRLNSPAIQRDRHRTGVIRGMGTRH